MMNGKTDTAYNAKSGTSGPPYRTVKSEFYNFGYDDKAESKTRLIVKEKDLKNVREYELEDGINYYCFGCFNKDKSKNSAYFDEDGFLLVPTCHVCELIPAEMSAADQKRKRTKFMEAKKAEKSAPSTVSSAPTNPSLSFDSSNNASNTPTTFADSNVSNTATSPVDSNVLSTATTPADSLSNVPFIDLTDDFDDAQVVDESMLSSVGMDRSNCSSPEYIPEPSPSNSRPSR
jgi:hypothetical protein